MLPDTGERGNKMDRQKILLPYNFSDQDQKALEFVVQTFAHLEKTEIILFNAYTPVPVISEREAPIMDKVQSSLRHLNNIIKEQEELLENAKSHLMKNGFSENRIRVFFRPKKKDIASQIIQIVEDEKVNIIVLNRKSDKVGRFFTGSVFSKVVSALKNRTICIVN